MTRMGRTLRTLAAVAAGMFAVLAVMSLGWLSPEGLSNFDARLLGYDADDARAYLAVLPESSRALYLGWFRTLDTVFPVLASLATGGILWLSTADWHILQLVVSLGMVLAYLMMDLAENSVVGRIIERDDPVDAALANRASDLTQLKWLFLALSLVLLGAVWRHKQGRVA